MLGGEYYIQNLYEAGHFLWLEMWASHYYREIEHACYSPNFHDQGSVHPGEM